MLSLRRKNSKTLNYERIALVVVLAVGLIGLGIWITRVAQNINGPSIEYSEGFIVYLARLFGSGDWQYQAITQGPPFETSFYTPLFYEILGNIGGTLLAGRILDIFCALVSMFLVFLIVLHLSKNAWLAAIGALIPVTQYIFIQWSLILKTDLMAMMFELMGIALVIVDRRSKWVYMSVIWFALAFCTKQSFIAGALAVVVYLFLENKRQAAIFSGLMLAAIGIPFAVMTVSTGGEFFHQILTYQQTSPAFTGIWNYLNWLVLDFWTLLPALILAIFYAFSKPKSLPVIYAGIVLVITVFSIARSGSSQIYMFPAIFVMAIVAPLGFQEVVKRRLTIYIALMLIPLVALFGQGLVYFSTPEYAADVKRAEVLISDADYPILTENANMVLDAGQIPYLCDPFVFMNLAELGIWDEQPLLDDLNNKKIPYVVTQLPLPATRIRRWSWPVQDAIQANYHVIQDCSHYPYGFMIYKRNE